MANDQAVNITKMTEVAGFDSAGKSAPSVQVTFTVGTHGPFTQVFPKATFDPVQARATLQEFAQKIQTLHSGM